MMETVAAFSVEVSVVAIAVRAETTGDAERIRDVTTAAFASAEHSSGTEAAIVNALREAGALTVSMVAVMEGEVVGHVALSPVTISEGCESWLGLAPVSVLPAWQRRGVGSALVERALEQARALRAAGVVVLGEPSFYSRFGFACDDRLHYADVPVKYFQALRFGDDDAQGEVMYHPAFGAA